MEIIDNTIEKLKDVAGDEVETFKKDLGGM